MKPSNKASRTKSKSPRTTAKRDARYSAKPHGAPARGPRPAKHATATKRPPNRSGSAGSHPAKHRRADSPKPPYKTKPAATHNRTGKPYEQKPSRSSHSKGFDEGKRFATPSHTKKPYADKDTKQGRFAKKPYATEKKPYASQRRFSAKQSSADRDNSERGDRDNRAPFKKFRSDRPQSKPHAFAKRNRHSAGTREKFRPRPPARKPHTADRPPQNDASDTPRQRRGLTVSKWISPDAQTALPQPATASSSPAADKSEKVQKILAHCGLGARREMEVLIEQGRVRVNGERVQLGARATATDRIAVDGKPIPRVAQPKRLLIYHKPKGKWVSREPGVDSVFDDLPPLPEGRWLNIGRLDINTEGLLLFSTNGEWVQELAHPSHGYEREYHARVCGKLPPDELRAIVQRGVYLPGEKRVLRPLAFEQKAQHGDGINFWYRIVLAEGRNRAVRRIFEHYNLQVSRLLRVRFGPYELPEDLPPQHYREIPYKK